MESLVSGAIALVVPSLDEGFGFPPLEAMARGVPVLCARREPMTRQLGNAPLWFEPAESASLWRMLDRLVDSEALCAEQIELGFEIAKFFQWDRTALHYFELYRKSVAA
jgi:glycosyltransferase involved in cell wall biosynthesis